MHRRDLANNMLGEGKTDHGYYGAYILLPVKRTFSFFSALTPPK